MAAAAMAVQDGHIDPNEKKAIALIALRLGCSEAEMRQVFERPGSVAPVVPRRHEDRLLSLVDMLIVAYADGDFSTEEQLAFAAIARAYEIPAKTAALLIAAIEAGETSPEKLLSSL
jgi:alkylhydroperoxidase family enzyme